MYLYAAILLAGLLSGFAGGWKVQAWRHDSAALAAQEQARETERMRRQAANSAAGKHEQARERIRVQIETVREEVERVIEKPVYRNVCLDPDGLHALAEAARSTGYPGKPSGAVSAPRPAD